MLTPQSTAFNGVRSDLAQLDRSGVRRVAAFAGGLIAGSALILAIQSWNVPLLNFWDVLRSSWVWLLSAITFLVSWMAVIVAIYRASAPEEKGERARVFGWLLKALDYRPLIAVEMAIVTLSFAFYGFAPLPARLLPPPRTALDSGDISCDTGLDVNPQGQRVGNVVAEGGVELRGGDNCGAFYQVNFHELTLFQADTRDLLSVFLSIGEADCSAGDKSPPANHQVYFLDGAVEMDVWDDTGFLSRDCLSLTRMLTGKSTARIWFAFGYDCSSIPDPPEVIVALKVRGRFATYDRPLTIDLSHLARNHESDCHRYDRS